MPALQYSFLPIIFLPHLLFFLIHYETEFFRVTTKLKLTENSCFAGFPGGHQIPQKKLKGILPSAEATAELLLYDITGLEKFTIIFIG